MFIDVVDTLELGPLVDRPRQRTNLNLQFLFQFVEEVEWIASLTVHLVDKDDDWRLAHAADRHQLTCLHLDTFGTVDDDDGRVDGSKCAECVLGEVLVSGGVEDIHLVLNIFTVRSIVELHD